jgi:hypothetical protein
MIPAKETYQTLINIIKKTEETRESSLYIFPVQGTDATPA